MGKRVPCILFHFGQFISSVIRIHIPLSLYSQDICVRYSFEGIMKNSHSILFETFSRHQWNENLFRQVNGIDAFCMNLSRADSHQLIQWHLIITYYLLTIWIWIVLLILIQLLISILSASLQICSNLYLCANGQYSVSFTTIWEWGVKKKNSSDYWYLQRPMVNGIFALVHFIPNQLTQIDGTCVSSRPKRTMIIFSIFNRLYACVWLEKHFCSVFLSHLNSVRFVYVCVTPNWFYFWCLMECIESKQFNCMNEFGYFGWCRIDRVGRIYNWQRCDSSGWARALSACGVQCVLENNNRFDHTFNECNQTDNSIGLNNIVFFFFFSVDTVFFFVVLIWSGPIEIMSGIKPNVVQNVSIQIKLIR